MSVLIDPTSLLYTGGRPAPATSIVRRGTGGAGPVANGLPSVASMAPGTQPGDREYAFAVIKGSGIIPTPATGGWAPLITPQLVSSGRFAAWARWVPVNPTGFPVNPTDSAGAAATSSNGYTVSTVAFGGVDADKPEETVPQIAAHASARYRWVGGRAASSSGGDITTVKGCTTLCVVMHTSASRNLSDASATAAYGTTMWNTHLEQLFDRTDAVGPQVKGAFEINRAAGPIGNRQIILTSAAVSCIVQFSIRPDTPTV